MDESIEFQISRLKHTDWQERKAAAYFLGETNDLSVVEPLIAALSDKDWYVRAEAIESLGKLKAVTALKPLTVALKDVYWDVRRRAVKAFGKFNDLLAVEALIPLLNDSSTFVRMETAEVLNEFNADGKLALRLVAETRLTARQRSEILEAMRNIDFNESSVRLRFSLPDISIYCKELLKENNDTVKSGAEEILEWLETKTLLRAGTQDEAERHELMRIPNRGTQQGDEQTLMRPLDE